MLIYVDIDGTICHTPGIEYEAAVPNQKAIDVVNGWFREGHTIVYWTARGRLSGKDYAHLTQGQLATWGCQYHRLSFDKPLYDVLWDDRANNARDIK